MNFKNSNIYKKLYKFKRNIVKSIRYSRHAYYLRAMYYKYLVLKLNNKAEINIVFLVVFDSVWKYDGLYQLMIKDPRFNPTILVIPFIQHGNEVMIKNLDQTYSYFEKKGYNVMNSLTESGEWMDAKKVLNPDIVFFTVPYDYTLPHYRISNFIDTLTCYVPYAFVVIQELNYHYSSYFYSCLWRYFCETEFHLEVGKSLMVNKGKNIIVTGYPTFDILRPTNHYIEKKERKIVIWAPHHTINNFGSGLNYSCFEHFAYFFLDIANKYSQEIDFILKPHPLLKQKLYEHKDWGKEKTDLYFLNWNFLQNCSLEEGDYVDLFLKSDALIHDSASFMSEYLITEKPAAFTYRDADISNRINQFGNYLLKLHYKIETFEDLDIFLQNVVLKNKDDRKEERLKKLAHYFKNSYATSPSDAILNEIKKRI